MNKPIRAVSIFCMFLFLALMANVTYLQFFRSEDYNTDPRNARVIQPLAAMAEHASATFWPRGAIQAGVAGLVGLVIAAVAFVLSIPVLSGIAMVVGGFMALLAVLTFVAEGRAAARRRRDPG